MSAELRQITNTEPWMQWEGKLVNDTYPLREFLGSSDHSGVFLTEQRTENRRDVAIKFLLADSVQAEAQLVQWGATTALVHPNLVRIFDVGRYRSHGREFLFVVMEHADQTLAEILPRRALAPEEARDLLLPALDTLLFLHRKGLIHGRLKPSNFLAVNDRLKLSSDTIRPISHVASGSGRTSAYDPPELQDRPLNAAADMWGLGMTLLEALTQHTTAWPDEIVSVPADLPAQFSTTVLRCLSIAPGGRPTALDLDDQYRGAPRPQSTPAAAQPSAKPATSPPKVAQPQTPQPKAAPPKAPEPKVAPAKAAQPKTAPTKTTPPKNAQPKPPRRPASWRRAVAIILPFAVIAGLIVYFFGNKPAPPAPLPPPAAVNTPAPVVPPTVAKPEEPPVPAATAPTPQPAAALPKDVVQEVLPDVPAENLNKIRGRIHVTVRVLVNREGNVFGTMVENPGPNKFLAELAEQAAADWKFVPAARPKSRVWLVLFVFTRDGVKVRPIPQ